MAHEGAALLARKVAVAGFDPAAFPLLQGMASDLSRAVSALAGNLFDSRVDVKTTGKFISLAEFVGDSPDNSTYRWVRADLTPIALIGVDALFVNACAERLLGGRKVDVSNDSPSDLDCRLLEPLWLQLMNAVSESVKRLTKADMNKLHIDERISRDGKEAVLHRETVAVYRASFQMTLSNGSRLGTCSLGMPKKRLDQLGLLSKAVAADITHAPETPWSDALRRTLARTELPVDIIADKLTLTVGELSRLDVGQILPLERKSLNGLDIVLQTNAGDVSIGKCRLGAYGGKKAAKLSADMDPELGGLFD